MRPLPDFNSNTLPDLVRHLEARAHRARPGLTRASYLAIDREMKQLLERLETYHPDYFKHRLEQGTLPTPDSTERFTPKPKGHKYGGGWLKGQTQAGQQCFRKSAQRFLDDLLAGRPNDRVKRNQVSITAWLPVDVVTRIALVAKERNQPIAFIAREVLVAHFSASQDPAQT